MGPTRSSRPPVGLVVAVVLPADSAVAAAVVEEAVVVVVVNNSLDVHSVAADVADMAVHDRHRLHSTVVVEAFAGAVADDDGAVVVVVGHSCNFAVALVVVRVVA
jgi:hypothetical protein